MTQRETDEGAHVAHERHEFFRDHRPLLRSGLLMFAVFAVLGVPSILRMIVSQEDMPANVRAGLIFLASLSLVYLLTAIWLTRREEVLLRVGPDGVELPRKKVGPVPWDKTKRIYVYARTIRAGSIFPTRVTWLYFEFRTGVGQAVKTYHLSTRFDVLLIRNKRSQLNADHEDVVASIERFFPVDTWR